MTKHKSFLAAILFVGVIATAVSAQDQGGSGGQSGPDMMRGKGEHGRGQHGPNHQGNPVRHRVVRFQGGVPAPYAQMKNPLPETDAHVSAGGRLYKEQCASCHGFTGKGDGPAGSGLRPKPANLAFIMNRWIATDGFLMWAMSEGGQPLQTTMPAFKDALSEKERWQIVLFLRADIALEN